MRGSLGEVQIRRRTAGRSILDEHENDLLEQAINSNSAAIRDLLLGRLLESFCYQVVDQSRRCGVLWPPFSRLPSISADEVVLSATRSVKLIIIAKPCNFRQLTSSVNLTADPGYHSTLLPKT